MGKSKDYVKKQRHRTGNKDSKKSKYPKIQHFESPAGHVKIVDNTEDNTRMAWFHQKGTYTEWNHDGGAVSHTVDDKIDYVRGGTSQTVDQNTDVSVGGHQRVVVEGGAYIEVAGHAAIGAAGDTTVFSKGNLNAHVDNLYFGVKGNAKMHVDGNWDMIIKGDTSFRTSGDMMNKVGGSHLMQSGDDTTLKAPTFNVRANIKHKGDNTQSGTHTDSNGVHC